MKKERKLANCLILPQFQLTLIVVNILIMTLAFGIIFYQIYISFDQLYAIGRGLRLPENSAFFTLLKNQQNAIEGKLIIAAVISYIFSFVLTILISHRLAGPIYRLKMYFSDMIKQGHTKDLTFRKGDFYSDLPGIVNEGIKNIHKPKS